MLLEALEELRWQLEKAYEDAEGLLTLDGASTELNVVFKAWHTNLVKVKVKDEREHLFGSYLLGLCYKSRRPTPEADSLRSKLILKFTQDCGRLLVIMQNAAEYLFAVEKLPSPRSAEIVESGDTVPVAADAQGSHENEGSGRATEGRHGQIATNPQGDQEGAMLKKRWWHSPEETRPPEFPHGPLKGKQIALAEAICPYLKRATSRVALHTLGKDGILWIVKYRSQLCEVFFRDHVTWSESNASWKKTQETNK